MIKAIRLLLGKVVEDIDAGNSNIDASVKSYCKTGADNLKVTVAGEYVISAGELSEKVTVKSIAK